MTLTRAGRRRYERFLQRVRVVGLSFALGVLVDAGLTWRLQDPARDAQAGISASGEHPEPAGGTRIDPVMRAAPPDAAPPVMGAAPSDHASRDRQPDAGAREYAAAGLSDRQLVLPVDGVSRSDLRDSFVDPRGSSRTHEALDIMAPRGTPILATDNGTIAKLFESKAGGLTIYQFDPAAVYCYYYAHLDHYARGLAEGQTVARGQIIGYVGSTGNASPDAPHLHFALFKLGPERQWWKGEPINPFPLFAGR